jgi:hypothetical protein
MDLNKELAALDSAKDALRVLHWLGSMNCSDARLVCNTDKYDTLESARVIREALSRVLCRTTIRTVVFDQIRKQANEDVIAAYAVLSAYAAKTAEQPSIKTPPPIPNMTGAYYPPQSYGVSAGIGPHPGVPAFDYDHDRIAAEALAKQAQIDKQLKALEDVDDDIASLAEKLSP